MKIILIFIKSFVDLQHTKTKDMKTIDLKKIMLARNLERKHLAAELFPDLKHQVLALDRVLNTDAVLDENQISKLASIAGLSIAELYGDWKSETKNNTHTFSCGEWEAKLNTETWVTTVYKSGDIFHEDVIHSGLIPLSEYINELNNIISKS